MKVEEKFNCISHNMAILTVSLWNKFELFKEFGSTKLEFGSVEKKNLDTDEYREMDLKKELEVERSISSTITSSQSLFEVEEKVDINPSKDESFSIKFNQWLIGGKI